MADILDELATGLREALGVRRRAIPSAAPGAGPEAERENLRAVLGGRIGTHIPSGGDASGFGGHGDASIVVEDVSTDVQHMVARHFATMRKGLTDKVPQGKVRLSKPFSIDGHVDDEWKAVCGPVSLFNGTITAPGAGNSLVPVPVTIPTNAVSPVELLYRYPGALYMLPYLRTFAACPTGTTTTGLQEYWFTDVGGATTGLGIQPANVQPAGVTSIHAMLATPQTDSGNITLGNLMVNNIGIGGTPTSIRWQITISYVGVYADPEFNQHMIIPPLPAEVAQALASMGAQGS